jgi:microcystin degradation protein MlrC
MTSLCAIRDTPTALELWDLPDGAAFEGQVGGRHPGSSAALPIRGTILSRHEGDAFGKRVAVDLGHVKLIIAEKAPLVLRPNYYRQLGLHPSRADICLVKVFFPFRLYFALHNRLTIYTKTRGASDLDAALRFDFDAPTHPKDFVEAWRPADRLRRLGVS